jgi:hypothetical protein
MVDTAASSDAGPGEDLIARALASAPLYRPVPGDPVYHVRVDEQVVLVAEHDLSGSLYDLVTAVLAVGEALHRAGGQPAARDSSATFHGDDSSRACHTEPPDRSAPLLTWRLWSSATCRKIALRGRIKS